MIRVIRKSSRKIWASLPRLQLTRQQFATQAQLQLQPLLENEFHRKRLLAIAEADVGLAEMLEKQSSSSSGAGASVPPLATRQMQLIALNAFIPFFGFGFFDNFIMIVAGDAVDTTLCVVMGYGTMVAAAIGNTMSDQIGLALGGVIETCAEKLGLPTSGATEEQQGALQYKLSFHGGSMLGIIIGCIVGSFPLLFERQSGEELRKLKAQEDDLAKMVEGKLAKLVDADRTSLFVVDQSKQVLFSKLHKDVAGRIEVPLDGPSFVAKCYRAAAPLTQENMPEHLSKFGYRMHSMLCLPIFGPNGVIGVVQMLNKQSKPAFTKEDEMIGQKFTTMLAFVLQGARDYTASREELEREARADSSRRSTKDLQNEAFNAVVNDLSAMVGADRASLFLVDDQENSMFTIVAQNSSRIRVPAGQGLVGHVAMTGEIVNVVDAYQTEMFNREVDKATGYRTRSVLAMPVFSGDGVILGVIECMNKKGEGTPKFTSDDEALVKAFALHIAVAVMGQNSSFHSVVEAFRHRQF